MTEGRARTYTWAYVLIAFSFIWTAWNFGQPVGDTASFCLFKNATGVACPSCGTTRALLLLLHGHLEAALMMNPIGFLAASAMLMFPILYLIGLITKSRPVETTLSLLEKWVRRPYLAIPLIILVLSNWVWSIHKGL